MLPIIGNYLMASREWRSASSLILSPFLNLKSILSSSATLLITALMILAFSLISVPGVISDSPALTACLSLSSGSNWQLIQRKPLARPSLKLASRCCKIFCLCLARRTNSSMPLSRINDRLSGTLRQEIKESI